MPYSTLAELPKNVKTLPTKAQRIWRAAFNSAVSRYNDEERAFKIAWGAVSNAGYTRKMVWVEPEEEITLEMLDEAIEKSITEFEAEQETFKLQKIDQTNHLVFGWASVAIDNEGNQVVDKQNDIIELDELEPAVYEFVLKSGHASSNHTGLFKGFLVESVLITEEKLLAMGVPEDVITKGIINSGWWVGFYIPNDDDMQKIIDGDYEMFSIGGTAKKVKIDG